MPASPDNSRGDSVLTAYPELNGVGGDRLALGRRERVELPGPNGPGDEQASPGKVTCGRRREDVLERQLGFERLDGRSVGRPATRGCMESGSKPEANALRVEGKMATSLSVCSAAAAPAASPSQPPSGTPASGSRRRSPSRT